MLLNRESGKESAVAVPVIQPVGMALVARLHTGCFIASAKHPMPFSATLGQS